MEVITFTTTKKQSRNTFTKEIRYLYHENYKAIIKEM